MTLCPRTVRLQLSDIAGERVSGQMYHAEREKGGGRLVAEPPTACVREKAREVPLSQP